MGTPRSASRRSPTLSTAATASSPVGSYVINVSGAADPNYNISYVTGTLTVIPDVPAVSSIISNLGPTAGGTPVTITGTNLSYVTAVYFGATAASNITVNSDTQIVVTSPAGTVGTVDVTVTTADGVSAILSADQFRYVAAPVVFGIDNLSGSVWGNTLVNIYGSNLADATTAVFFGTTPAVAFSVISQGQILALSPAGAGTADVTVVTAGGSSPGLPAGQFTYLPATLTWDGVAVGNWTNAQWSGLGLSYPDSRANAIIGSGSVVQVTSDQAANSLSIQSNAQVAVGPEAILSVTTDTSVTGGGSLNLDPNGAFSTDGTLTLDTGGSLVGGPISAAAYQFNDGMAGADLSGPGGLSKDTGGTVILSGANYYAGPTVVKAGKLIVTSSSALPGGTNLTVGAGGVFDFDPSQAGEPVVALASSAVSATSTAIVAAGVVANAPVALSALSGSSPSLVRPVENLTNEPAAALSRAASDAVFKSYRSTFDRTVTPADNAQSTSAWAWLAAIESSWDSSDQNKNGRSTTDMAQFAS